MKNTRTRRIGKRYRSSLYKTRFLEDLRDFPEAPSILSEGDSWFGYPVGRDLNDCISLLGSYNIRHFEKSGDELIDDMMNERQKSLLIKAMKTHQFKLMLYSGGGNDIVAENLKHYIMNDESGIGPQNRINQVATEARIDEIKVHYLELINLVKQHQDNCPIIVHGYDYIIPSDKGFEIIGLKLAGPWVKPTLDQKGVAPEHQADVINFIMDNFNQMLKQIADQHANFHYVDLRGILTKKRDWANEIHPTAKGFSKLAACYRSKMKALLPEATI